MQIISYCCQRTNMDWFDRVTRNTDETDEQLRIRITDNQIAKLARNAMWRVFGVRNKDKYNYDYSPIKVLGIFEPVEIMPEDD